MPGLLCALDAWLVPSQQIIVSTPTADPPEALSWARQSYAPHRSVLWLEGAAYQRQLSARLPYLAASKPVGGKITVSLCRDFHCGQPTVNSVVIRRILQSEAPDPVNERSLSR